MLFRIFSTLFAPARSYGCEVWGSQCRGRPVSDSESLQRVQVTFPRNVWGSWPVNIPAAAIFAEVAQDPCSLKWWVQLVGFALRMSDQPQGSLHHEVLCDNVQDALARPSSANWSSHHVKHVWSLGWHATVFCSWYSSHLQVQAFVAMLLADP